MIATTLRRLARGLCPALGCLVLLAPAQAATRTLGSMTLEVPDDAAGWTAKVAKDGILLQKTFPKDEDNSRGGGALIEVNAPRTLPPAAFDAAFEQVAATVKDLAKERPMVKSAGTTSNGHRIRTDFRCCARMKGIALGQRTVGLASDDTQVFLALVTLGLHGKAQKSAEADFAALVRSVRLKPADQPFRLAPAAGDGGLDGVYTHLQTGLMPNVFGGLDFRADNEITVFDPGGLYATRIPEDGDVAAHCSRVPTDCGTYRLTGGGLFSAASRIEMRDVADMFGTLRTETKPFARTGEGLSIDKADYRRLPPLGHGATLDGTWHYTFASSGMTAMSSGSIAVERTLTLRRDGSFVRTGWAGGSSSNEIGGSHTGVTASAPNRTQSGRYRIDGFVLELTADGGQPERTSLFAPDVGSDGLLVISGNNYLKQK